MFKRYLKRVISFFLILMVLSLAACGANKGAEKTIGSQDSTVKTGSTANSSDPIAKYYPVEGKKYKIKWVSLASGAPDQNAEMVQYWNKQFNVDIELIYFDSSKYTELINLRFASGDIPDYFGVNPTSNLMSWKDQDLMAEIPEEAIKKISPVIYNSLTKLDPNYFSYGMVDGKIYGLRRYDSNYIYRSPIIWNMKWLKNIGMNQMPLTLEDAEKAYYKFKTDDPDKNGKNDTYAISKEGIYATFGSYGVYPGGSKFIVDDQWVEKDGKIMSSATAPELKPALTKLAKWYKDGLIDPEFITGENRGSSNTVSYSFIEGRIGMTNMGTYYHWMPAQVEGGYQGMNITELQKIYKDEVKDIVGYGPPPSVPGYNNVLPTNNPVSSPIAFGKHLEKEPDKMGKILSMLDYFNSSLDNFATAYKGIKDTHWKMVNGFPVSIGKYVEVAEQAKMGAHVTFVFGAVPAITLPTQSPGAIEFGLKYGLDKNKLDSKLKVPLSSMAKYSTELNKMRDEMILKIVTGDKPLDYFDEYVQKYNKAGGDEITKEANDWYAKIKNK